MIRPAVTTPTAKGKYQIMPDLTPEAYAKLKASIAERGGIEKRPIVDENGQMLDGFAREQICRELGIPCNQKEVRRFDSEADKLAFVVTVNVKRRQMGREQKKGLIRAFLLKDVAVGDNTLATLIGGISKNTVADVRAEMEAACLIDKVELRRGADGKTYPAKYVKIVVNSEKELGAALKAIKDLPANGKLMDATTAARHARRNVKKAERKGKPIIPLPEDSIRIYHCPFQELEKVAGIGSASVNFFYADIPYDGQFVEQVDALAAMAARVLVDGGVCAVMTGQFYLDKVMAMLGKHLTWQWAISSEWVGKATPIHQLHAVNNWKPILVYSKREWTITGRWSDVSRLTTQEKDWHPQQQPLEEVEMLVRTFSSPGDLVVDACGGGFTTAVACRNLGRRCISCDVDLQAVLAGQERLAGK